MSGQTQITVQNTQQPPSTQIMDFSIGLDLLDPRLARANAASFIGARWNKSNRLMAEQIRIAIEVGSAYEALFQMFQDGKFEDMSYTEWVTNHTHYNGDTVLNYRNLYKTFRDIVPKMPDEAFDGVQLRALYKLAVDTVSEGARSWFFDRMLENHKKGEVQLKGDLRLVAVAKNPEIRAWLDENPPYINFEQAVSLAEALPKCEAIIQEICLSERVKEGSVALVLNRLFLDFCRAKNEERPDKSWQDIVNNEYYFVWNGGERRVHISQANGDTCDLYLNWRRERHIWGDASKPKPPRKTAKIKRTGDSVTITIDTADFLPDGFTEGEISLDLLLDTLT